MNLLVKTGLAAGLDKLGLLSVLRYVRSAKQGIVLTFHRVLRDTDKHFSYDPYLVMSESVFEQLLILLRREFQVVSLEQILEHPERTEQRQRVALTFDDGWEDTYSVVYPHLLRYQMPATVFLCTGLMEPQQMIPEERFGRIWHHCVQTGRLPLLLEDLRKWGAPPSTSKERRSWSQYLKKLTLKTKLVLLSHLEDSYSVPSDSRRHLLTWEEAQIMARNNITFGSHTVNHCTLTAEQDSNILHELKHSRDDLYQQLNVEARFLAYPNGCCNPRIMNLAREAGFSHAFTTEMNYVTRTTNPYAIPRFAMDDFVVSDQSASLNPSRARFYLQALSGGSLARLLPGVLHPITAV